MSSEGLEATEEEMQGAFESQDDGQMDQDAADEPELSAS
jgi:hypothetical protein